MAIKLTKQLTFNKNKIVFICIKCGKQLLVDRIFRDFNHITKIISTCTNCLSNDDIEIHLDKYEYFVLKQQRINRENIKSDIKSNSSYEDHIQINWERFFRSIKTNSFSSYDTFSTFFNPWED